MAADASKGQKKILLPESPRELSYKLLRKKVLYRKQKAGTEPIRPGYLSYSKGFGGRFRQRQRFFSSDYHASYNNWSKDSTGQAISDPKNGHISNSVKTPPSSVNVLRLVASAYMKTQRGLAKLRAESGGMNWEFYGDDLRPCPTRENEAFSAPAALPSDHILLTAEEPLTDKTELSVRPPLMLDAVSNLSEDAAESQDPENLPQLTLARCEEWILSSSQYFGKNCNPNACGDCSEGFATPSASIESALAESVRAEDSVSQNGLRNSDDGS